MRRSGSQAVLTQRMELKLESENADQVGICPVDGNVPNGVSKLQP